MQYNLVYAAVGGALDTAEVQKELDETVAIILADHDKGITILDNLNSCLESTTEFKLQSRLHSLYGFAYYLKKDADNAIYHYELSMAKAKKIKDLLLLGKAQYNAGLVYAALKDDIYQANISFESALQHALNIDNKQLSLNCYRGIGNNYRLLEQLDASENNYAKALDLAIQLRDTLMIQETKLELASIAQLQGAIEKSNKMLTSIDIQAISSNKLLAMFYKQKAINNENQDFEKAYEYIQKAVQYTEPMVYYDAKIEIYLYAAFFEERRKNWGGVQYYINKIEPYSEYYSFYFQERLFGLKSRYFAYLGQYDEARKYVLLSTKAKENLISEKNLTTLSKLKKKRENVKQDKELLEQKMKIKEQEEEMFRRKSAYINISIFLMIVFILIVTFMLYKSSQKYADFNAKLTEQNAKLYQKDIEKSKFIDSITHELRTPLYTISGIIELLRSGTTIKERDNYLEILNFSGNYLSNFVENMISINTYTTTVSVEKIPFDLRALIDNIVNSIKIVGTNNVLTVFVDAHIPARVVGDAHKLSQILFNLINNANKFTSNGQITVNVRCSGLTPTSVPLYFEVLDTGIGINDENKKKVFQKFYRVHASEGFKDGTGIGLSVVKKLIELQGGTIELESTLGKGSRFFFNINFDNTSSQPIMHESNPLENSSIATPAMLIKKVLLVEDNKINQLIVSKILQRNGLDCTVASNGKEAVALVRQESFDLILMDYLMPIMNGLEAIQEIRTFNKKVEIFALTAISRSTNQQKFLNIGANKVLTKPIEPSKLLEAITKTKLEMDS